MKWFRIIKNLSIILIVLLAFSGCMGKTVRVSPEDYKEGQRTAEKMAKQDAIAENCFNSRPSYQGKYHEHLRRHREAMKNESRSYDYIQGFEFGYRRHFYEYMDLYCGI